MGGSAESWVDKPANGLTVCGSGVAGCHGDIESNRELAISLGLLIRRTAGQRAENVPVWLPVLDGFYCLGNDGSRLLLPMWREEQLGLVRPSGRLFR